MSQYPSWSPWAWADFFDDIRAENHRTFRNWSKEAWKEAHEARRTGHVVQAAMSGGESFLASYWGGVSDILGVAGTTLTDLGRIGQGFRRMTAWGAVEDTLRVATMVSGGLKLARYFQVAAPLGGEGSCVLSSTSKALAIAGRRFNIGATYNAMEKFLGYSPGATKLAPFEGTGLVSARKFMNELRIAHTRIIIKSLDDVKAATNTFFGLYRPVIFGAVGKIPQYSSSGVAEVGHVMVAFRDFAGRVRFADQVGRLMSEKDLLVGLRDVYEVAYVPEFSRVVRAMHYGTIAHLLYEPVVRLTSEEWLGFELAVRKLTRRPLVSPLIPRQNSGVDAKSSGSSSGGAAPKASPPPAKAPQAASSAPSAPANAPPGPPLIVIPSHDGMVVVHD